MDRPSELEPLEIRCPSCSGGGCSVCGDGWQTLIGCPKQYVTEDIVECFRACELLQKGLPPMTGGYFDQPATVMSAIQIIEAVEPAQPDLEQYG